MNSKCNYCINKTACDECKKNGWFANFIPSEDVKKYFTNGYNGVRGYDGKHSWNFNTTNEDLKETHSILIQNNHYCSYCGSKMFSIQKNILKYKDYSVTGHCCICEGARTELEYEKEKELLEAKHNNELKNLQEKYTDKLKFDSEKLFKIKQEKEKARFNIYNYNYSYFTFSNHEKTNNIDEIIF